MTNQNDPNPQNLYTYKARLVRVIDGDTYELEIDLGFHTYARRHIRLQGVDCPELHTPRGIATATIAARWFAEVEGAVVIHTTKYDRYGRTLATVTNPTATTPNLAAYLLKHGCKRWTGRK